MRVNGFFIYLLFFLGTLVLSSVYLPLRYLKYFLPLVPLALFYFNRGALNVHRSIFNYYATFIAFYSIVIAYLLINNLLFSSLSFRFFPNAVFMLSPLLFITFALPYFRRDMVDKYLFLVVAVNVFLFFYEEGGDLFSVLTDLSVIKNAFLTSVIPTESNLAFVFGFFVIYFILERRSRLYQVIAICFFLLCFKRIAIAAVVLSVGVYFLLSFLRINISEHRKKAVFLGVLVNWLFVKMTALIVSGAFDELVLSTMGISTDRLLMGRQQFYTQVFTHASGNWFGLGLGKVDDIMYDFMHFPINLHSEVLRNYFELGFIIFTIWIALLFYKNVFSNKAAVLFLYFNILILSDNVFVYFDIMFYFYFFILIYLAQQNEGRAGMGKEGNELL